MVDKTKSSYIALAVLLFVITLLISSFRIVREYEFIGGKFIPNLWVAAQAEIEFLRFIDQLGAHVYRETENTDELAKRLYVLWSRLPLILQGSESEHVRAVSGAVQTIQALTATLERLEPSVLGLRKGDLATYREIYAALRPFEIPLHQIVAQTMQKDEEVAAAQREGIRAVYWEVLWCFLGMVASAVILVALLFRAVRNVSSLLRVAHAAEATAAQASRAKSEFLAAMSHEIRTPLTGVLGMADLLAAADLPEKERRYVDAIRTSGRHLLSVINDILDFSRIEAGKLELEQVDFSIPRSSKGPLADGAAGGRARARPQVRRSTSPPDRWSRATRPGCARCCSIWSATRSSSPIRAGSPCGPRAAQQMGTAWFCCASRSKTPASVLLQTSRATCSNPSPKPTDRPAGPTAAAGSGWRSASAWSQAMGGAIGVESTPGRGSTFWSEIPFARGDAAAAAKRSTSEPASIRPLRVLVVDDVAGNRELLEEMLARHGHEVLLAEDGAAAVELAARERPDVVLMDVQMPVMDGMEATRRIRRLPPPAGAVPILALTANVMAAERERYLACGMDRCLTKPVVWPDLFATLAESTSPSGSPTLRAAASEPRTTAPSSAAGSEPPLLDRSPSSILNDEKLAGLLQRVIVDAERACERCRTLPADSKELLREVHALKGTAGLFGLQRIGAAAADVQAAAGDEQATSTSAARLAAAVAATREALEEAELIRQG